MAAEQGEMRIYYVQCVCDKVIQVKMPFGEFSSKAEKTLKNRVKQHAYSLTDDGQHAELGWKDVGEMPALSYNLGWEDKKEVPLSLTRKPSIGRTTLENSSDDDSTPPQKRARLEEGHSIPTSSPRPFSELDRDEELNKLDIILERVESKLDEVLESVSLL